MKGLVHPVTAEELLHMPDNGMRRELVRGEVREMPPAGAEHGSIAGNIFFELKKFNEAQKLGCLFIAETGFFIERDPDTVLAPDCAFVRNERLPDPIPKGFFPMAPDLAVETLSPDDRPGEVREKISQLLQSGTRAVWVVDPGKREVTVHRPGTPPRVLGSGDLLEGEDVLPGFSLPVAKIF